MIQVDMERGLYDWGRKPPRKKDGSLVVNKARILKDLGVTPDYHDAKHRIWENPHYLRLLKEERRRRDLGISDMVAEVEKQVAPLNTTYVAIDKHISAIFEAGPDPDGDLGLRPRDYVHEGLAVMKHIEEQEGRSASLKAQGLDAVIAAVGANISGAMVGEARELLQQARELQDSRLRHVIEGQLDED